MPLVSIEMQSSTVTSQARIQPLELATIGLSSKLDSDQVRSQVSEFLQAKFDSDAIGSFYGQYREMSSKLDAVYASYAIESKRWNGYKGK